MSELTKEYFEKHLERQLKLNKEHFEEVLDRQLKLHKEHFEEKLEELAQSVSVGFRGVDERFDRVDARFDKVEGRLDKVEGRLDKVDSRLGVLERGQNELIQTVNKLETRHRKESQETTLLRGLYHRLDDRVTKLEGAQA